MPELKDVLEGVLVKAHGFTAEEVSSLFSDDGTVKEDAQETVLNRVADRVKKERDEQKRLREQQLMRGRREGAEKLEKFFKAEGVDLGDLTFESDEAFDKVREAIKGPKTPASGSMDDNAIKNTDFFRKWEKERIAERENLDKEWKEKWSQRDAKEQRERTSSQAKATARAYLLEVVKPNLPADPKRAQTQLDLFLAEFDQFNFDIDGEAIYVKDAEGKRIENNHGSQLQFNDWVKDRALQRWDPQVSEPKNNAGNVTQGTKSNGAGAVKPANRKEYAEALMKLSDDFTMKPEEKQARLAELKALEPTLQG